MATTVDNIGDYSFLPQTTGAKNTTKRQGVLSRLWAKFVASREAWAKDAVDAHLTTLSDNELAAMGFSEYRIGEIRRNVRGRQTIVL